MSSATPGEFVKDAWRAPRHARTLRALMALENQEIADRLKALRAAKGSPPQTTVAAAIGVGERTLQTWEQADAKPNYRSLQALAEYYGVGEDFILTGVSKPGTPDLSLVEAIHDRARTEFRGDVDDVQGRLTRIERTLADLVAQLSSAEPTGTGTAGEDPVQHGEAADRRRAERRQRTDGDADAPDARDARQ